MLFTEYVVYENFLCYLIVLLHFFTLLLAAIVNERIQEAHRDKSAPMMMLFPGYQFTFICIMSKPSSRIAFSLCKSMLQGFLCLLSAK